ncbi:hypothetical protein G9A89_015559 [Geosiphon pyriformis]|nr:hypothetical protein G9A89_015559 [Geosiphon pyriformis]
MSEGDNSNESTTEEPLKLGSTIKLENKSSAAYYSLKIGSISEHIDFEHGGQLEIEKQDEIRANFHGHSVNAYLMSELRNDNGETYFFKGEKPSNPYSSSKSTTKQCLLIFDEETQTWRLEILDGFFNLEHVNNGDPIASSSPTTPTILTPNRELNSTNISSPGSNLAVHSTRRNKPNSSRFSDQIASSKGHSNSIVLPSLGEIQSSHDLSQDNININDDSKTPRHEIDPDIEGLEETLVSMMTGENDEGAEDDLLIEDGIFVDDHSNSPSKESPVNNDGSNFPDFESAGSFSLASSSTSPGSRTEDENEIEASQSENSEEFNSELENLNAVLNTTVERSTLPRSRADNITMVSGSAELFEYEIFSNFAHFKTNWNTECKCDCKKKPRWTNFPRKIVRRDLFPIDGHSDEEQNDQEDSGSSSDSQEWVNTNSKYCEEVVSQVGSSGIKFFVETSFSANYQHIRQ